MNKPQVHAAMRVLAWLAVLCSSAILPAGWHIAGGVLSKEGTVGDLVMNESFGNFELELDPIWVTDSTPYVMRRFSPRYTWSAARKRGRRELFWRRMQCISAFENQAPRVSRPRYRKVA